MTNFWKTLPKPFFILAPMEDVTDTVFRHMVMRTARPDVFFTEFTSADGLVSRGSEKVKHRLQFTDDERPIVAQIWGNNPDHCYEAACIARDMHFDGIDINMGCPEKKIIKHGCCGALIRQPALAQSLVRAVQEGAGGLPISIKTRIGFDRIMTKEWLQVLLETRPAAITVHARTVREMSDVPAHWEEVAVAVDSRNQRGSETLIIGNGDVIDRADGMEKFRTYHPDGIMIGRGIFTDIWAFSEKPSDEEDRFLTKLALLREHIALFEKTWAGKKQFQIMKKYFKIYVSDHPGAHDLRIRLMETKNADEALAVLKMAL